MYKPIIGLEVHIELSTLSKMFCGCSANHFGKSPNTNTCPVCLGLPGALPYPNEKAIEYVIKLGLALNAKINNFSYFDRKHYFYQDLPKGYQISQNEMPFCTGGIWKNKEGRPFRIRRIHLEEDTAKSIHSEIDGQKYALIDFNRSGVPLMELVTEPDFSDPNDVSAFLRELQSIGRALDISSCDMEKGSMRLEGNISMYEDKGIFPPDRLPNYKVELKNINSFRFLNKAFLSEIERQKKALTDGKILIQETRGYDQSKNETFRQRVKETSADYRYFPEPDIPPIELDGDYIENIKKTIPELPREKYERYINKGIKSEYAQIISEDKNISSYFDQAVLLDQKYNIGVNTIIDMIINKKAWEKYPQPEELISFLYKKVSQGVISAEKLDNIIDKIIFENPSIIKQYLEGKEKVIQYLIGILMRETSGKVDIGKIKSLIIQKIRSK